MYIVVWQLQPMNIYIYSYSWYRIKCKSPDSIALKRFEAFVRSLRWLFEDMGMFKNIWDIQSHSHRASKTAHPGLETKWQLLGLGYMHFRFMTYF